MGSFPDATLILVFIIIPSQLQSCVYILLVDWNFGRSIVLVTIKYIESACTFTVVIKKSISRGGLQFHHFFTCFLAILVFVFLTTSLVTLFISPNVAEKNSFFGSTLVFANCLWIFFSSPNISFDFTYILAFIPSSAILIFTGLVVTPIFNSPGLVGSSAPYTAPSFGFLTFDFLIFSILYYRNKKMWHVLVLITRFIRKTT